MNARVWCGVWSELGGNNRTGSSFSTEVHDSRAALCDVICRVKYVLIKKILNAFQMLKYVVLNNINLYDCGLYLKSKPCLLAMWNESGLGFTY